MAKIRMMRCSGDFADIVNYVRAKYILAGKRPPPVPKITAIIAKRVNKEDLIKDEFILF